LVLYARTIPVDSVIITENSVADDLKIINEIAYTAEASIHPRTQSMLTGKSTPKTESLPTQKSLSKLLP
jgi:hypothetical protein